MIGLDDRGLLLGDGLFETFLARDGVLVWVDEHLDRLARGCAVLGLPDPSRDEARRLMAAALRAAGLSKARAAVRLTLTAGSGGRGLDRPDPVAPRMVATASPSPAPAGAVRGVWSDVRRNEGSPASRLKSLAYLDNVLARTQARAAGADEALMLNNRGEVACAGAANLFWIVDDRLHTPALECGVLDGIARSKVLAAAQALGVATAEARAAPAAVAGAQAVFLTNSLIGVRPVSHIDGRATGSSPLVERLAAAL